MAYFTAVLARVGSSWRARDVDVADAGSLEDLVDSLRVVAQDDEPVLAVLEHEDEWFAVVRVDGEEDPRVFVSDLDAASRGGFADVLATVSLTAPVAVAAHVEEDTATQPTPGAPEGGFPVAGWAGEADLLADLGIAASELSRLVEEHPDDPAAVLAEVGEGVGFGELLEALR